MQSGEPFFGLTLNELDVQIPWEWRPDQALRSISALTGHYFGVAIFLRLVRLVYSGTLSGYTLFLVQRANALLWTLSLDVAVAFVFPPRTSRYLLCLSGISTAATTFLVRPFSNSLEAHLLAFYFLKVMSFYKDRTWYKRGGVSGWHWGVIPAILAVNGFFTRFTFAFFALPLGIFLAYRFVNIAKQAHGRAAAISAATAIVAGMWTLSSKIRSETEFYTGSGEANGLQVATLLDSKWVVPPVNAMLYNVKTENVAKHGLHPRWFHAVVNLPMMIGVANCVVLVVHGWHLIQEWWHSRGGYETKIAAVKPAPAGRFQETDEEEVEQKEVEQAIRPSIQAGAASDNAASSSSSATANTEDEMDYVDLEPVAVLLSYCIIICSLFFLSLSPHQEPRFLLALCFPSALIMTYALQSPYFSLRPRLTRLLLGLHVAQHLLQLLLFSFLHQAALLPTLFDIDHSLSLAPHTGRQKIHLLYRTFQVPFHFLPHKGRDTFSHVGSYDSSTSPADVIRMASIACDHTSLYAPSWVVGALEKETERRGDVDLRRTARWTWHVDMDHLGESFGLVKQYGLREAFAIHKLEVRCKKGGQAEDSDAKEGSQGLAHEDL